MIAEIKLVRIIVLPLLHSELEKEDRIAKFRFKFLGLVEIKKRAKVVDPQPAAQPRKVVKV